MASNTNILLESGTNELEVVEFSIKYNSGDQSLSQSFGVNVAKVREIIRIPHLTKMPNLPPSVYGVFRLRGSIIPALDLGKYLYGTKFEIAEQKMIIAEFNKVRIGLIVSDVQRIHRISWQSITSPDSLQEFNSGNSSIVGIIQTVDKNILMLDIEKIVADIDPASAIDNSQPKESFKTKPHAITAEDSPTIRRMITERLASAGFVIESFNNGKDAWTRLLEISQEVKSGGDLSELCNIVITDIEMPVMDGYTLTKNIKSEASLKGLPVVIFSSIISQDVLHKGKSVGSDAQLSKPQIGELLDTVRVLLEK